MAEPATLAQTLGVFRYGRRALSLLWATSRGLTATFAALTIGAGLLPAVLAWVGQHIVDSVVSGVATGMAAPAIGWVALEAGAVVLLGAMQRGIQYTE